MQNCILTVIPEIKKVIYSSHGVCSLQKPAPQPYRAMNNTCCPTTSSVSQNVFLVAFKTKL